VIPLGHLSVLSLAATTWRLWLPRGGETSRCPPYPKADPSSSSFIPGFRDEAVRKRTSRAYECFAKRIKFSNKSKNLWTLQRQIPESESCQIAPRPHSHRRVRSTASAPPRTAASGHACDSLLLASPRASLTSTRCPGGCEHNFARITQHPRLVHMCNNLKRAKTGPRHPNIGSSGRPIVPFTRSSRQVCLPNPCLSGKKREAGRIRGLPLCRARASGR
jgi:hypothetical protein